MSLNKEDCKLFELASTKTNKFTLKGYKTYAKCVYVYDGDTVHMVFKQPHSNECFKWIIRINGIDTPEIKSKNHNEKNAAIIARDYLRSLILDKIIIVECGDFDKYGRLLGELYLEGNNIPLSKQMIEKGYAKTYDGGTKDGWGELDGK
jgi:micrococcal nuclease